MWIYQVALPSFLKLKYDLYIINSFFQNVKLSDFWYSHNLMQPSALSDSRIFSSFPKETSYPLAIHLHFFCCPVPAYYQAALCRFVYSGYFIHTDSYKTWLFVTDFFHPTNDLKVHLSVVLVLHFYG